MSLCEQLIGGSNLGAKQKSIIDRCTASPFSKRSADEVVDCPASGSVTPRASSTSFVIPTKSATFAMPT